MTTAISAIGATVSRAMDRLKSAAPVFGDGSARLGLARRGGRLDSSGRVAVSFPFRSEVRRHR
jgi:hypothetical protein